MFDIRGHSSHDGKFLHLFKLLAEFDPYAAAYLEKLDTIWTRKNRTKPELNFLSPLNMRHLITTMKGMIVDRISASVQIHGAYSIICDGTQDKSKLEAEAILVRYIESKNGRVLPVERIVDVFTTGDTTSEGLCDAVLNVFEHVNLSLKCWWAKTTMELEMFGVSFRAPITEKALKALYVTQHIKRDHLSQIKMFGISE